MASAVCFSVLSAMDVRSFGWYRCLYNQWVGWFTIQSTLFL